MRVLRGVVLAGASAALGVALLLAVLRFADPSNRLLVELVAFTPLGLPLALTALLAAAASPRSSPGPGVRTALVAAGVVLVGVHAWWLAPLYVGPPPPTRGGARLVVMTQNLERGEPAAVARLVAAHRVDVLVLTDTPVPLVAAVAAAVGDDLPRSTELTTGSAVFSRFPITGQRRISDGGDSRLVTLSVPRLGAVDLLALHPTPPYQQGRWTDDWAAVLDLVDRRWRGRVTGNVVVAGDLNATRDHAPLRWLGARGLSDPADQLNAGWRPTWPVRDTERLGVPVPPLLPLDHVLAGPGLAATALAFSDAAGSDHRAVVVTLARSGRSGGDRPAGLRSAPRRSTW